MDTLDLRNIRCPLALIKVKLLLKNKTAASKCEIKFSNKRAMQDIIRYLDAKEYSYKISMKNSIYIISF